MSKKPFLLLIFAAGLILAGCAPKEHMVDCNSTSGSYICFNNEGRDGLYTRWNFDTVETYNAFNIQGSYPAVPGTQPSWTTINISLVTSSGNFVMETGAYDYKEWLSNEGERQFTFYVRHFTGDAADPDTKTYRKKNPGTTILNITNIDGTGKLSGVFASDVRNVSDPNDSAQVKYYFTDVPIQ
jgi:hypothetical protein